MFGPRATNLRGYTLVKAFADELSHLSEENRLPPESFKTWGNLLAETEATPANMTDVGKWFVAHHEMIRGIGYIRHAVEVLLKKGWLPEHRLASETELNAMKLLEAAKSLGIKGDELCNSFVLAGSIQHLMCYHQLEMDIEDDYLSMELMGKVRISRELAREVIKEISNGVGELKSLQPYLLERNPI